MSISALKVPVPSTDSNYYDHNIYRYLKKLQAELANLNTSNNNDYSCPIGTIVMWGSTNIPEGWLELDGALISEFSYPELYSIYGAQLPDFRGLFPRGYGSNNINASSGELLQYQEYATARPHEVFKTNYTGTHGYHQDGFIKRVQVGKDNGVAYATDWLATKGGHEHYIMSGGDAETRPKNIAVIFIIKAKNVVK